eukprot:SAG31_NODE_1234_length_9204_cov_9.297748_4_plen_107_part_00
MDLFLVYKYGPERHCGCLHGSRRKCQKPWAVQSTILLRVLLLGLLVFSPVQAGSIDTPEHLLVVNSAQVNAGLGVLVVIAGQLQYMLMGGISVSVDNARPTDGAGR